MAAAPEQPNILSFEDARHVVERQAAGVQPSEMESVALLSSLSRVLAEPVVADRDLPPFRRAMRDGYAVRAADLGQLPATLDVLGEIKAGANREEIPGMLGEGQAVAIMTGAPAPPGAEAAVMVADTSRNGNQVTVKRSVKSGDNIVPEGAEARKGDRLLDAGTTIDYGALAVAASV